jgi:hypothetical protein
MNPKQPPSMAVWMLEHLVSGNLTEAFPGDLLEELRSGRSSRWYWRQVMCIIAISWRKEMLAHRMTFLFAAFWSVLALPGMALTHAVSFRNLVAMVRQMDWPWSAICPILVQILPLLAFIWAGLLLSLGLNAAITKHFSLRRFREGFVRSSLIFMPVWMAAAFLKLLLPPSPWVTTHFVCLPFFVTTLCAIWGMSLPDNIRKGLLSDRL